MTFEEITLLHRLTEHLSISKSVTDLCSLSVNWLADVIPAKSVAIWFESISDLHEPARVGARRGRKPVLIAHGKCPLRARASSAGSSSGSGPRVASEPLVLNRGATSSPTWFYPDIREIISVPIREGNRLFGWLLALNHTGAGDITNSEAEFGTVEACLMASVATILGIHCGNIALYHEQSEFFGSVVRALTSAIDAKDPYTCGHSDRVARLCRVPGPAAGLRQGGSEHDLPVGPAARHRQDRHRRQRAAQARPAHARRARAHQDASRAGLPDSRRRQAARQGAARRAPSPRSVERRRLPGRPEGRGDARSWPAIVAVADSIDAMSSDRPYRKGMPDEKLDTILRDGAGKQWDPKIVDAVFQVRDDLRRIGQEERKPLSLDVTHWQAETEMMGQIAAV